MTIAEDKVVVMHYSVSDENQLLDSSFDEQPLSFIAGRGFLLPGLESQLMGKAAGDRLDVELKAIDAYGERHDELVQEVPLEMFAGADVQVGMQFRATTDDGEQSVIVVDVTDEAVVVDGNHPLAGKDLNFSVEVMEVRDATAQELEHGHVHMAGGCCGGNSGGCGCSEGEGGCGEGRSGGGCGSGGCGCGH